MMKKYLIGVCAVILSGVCFAAESPFGRQMDCRYHAANSYPVILRGILNETGGTLQMTGIQHANGNPVTEQFARRIQGSSDDSGFEFAKFVSPDGKELVFSVVLPKEVKKDDYFTLNLVVWVNDDFHNDMQQENYHMTCVLR